MHVEFSHDNNEKTERENLYTLKQMLGMKLPKFYPTWGQLCIQPTIG